MKYAIHKLKQILESDQILFPVEREHLERAISYLSDITQCTAPEWDLTVVPEWNKAKVKVGDGPWQKLNETMTASKIYETNQQLDADWKVRVDKLVEAASEPFLKSASSFDLELDRLVMEYGDEEKLKRDNPLIVVDPNGPYAKEFAIEQNRLDMEATNREEKEVGVVPTAMEFIETRSNLGVVPDELPVGYGCDYAGVVPIEEQLFKQGLIGNPQSFEAEGRFVVPVEIPLQYQTCKHGTAFRYHCDECDDDDLGELDTSKACRLDNPECESCS